MNRAIFRRVLCTGRGWLLCAAALLASCGGGGDGTGNGGSTPPPAAGFELRLGGGSSIAAPSSSSGVLRVRIERRAGFSAPVEIGLANAPAGINAGTVVEAGDEALLPLSIAPGTAVGPIEVVINASGGGATATLPLRIDVQAPLPRAQALIAEALAAGRIDLGTSLLYRLYATFGDNKLPAEFVGSGPVEEDSSLFVEIEDARSTLPPSIVDAMQPYLVRPDDPRSVFNAGAPASRKLSAAAAAAAAAPSDQCSGTTPGWITARSALHPVRAWAYCRGTPYWNERAQKHLINILDVVDKAYGKMVDVMGPAKPDLTGDDAIDVYAVPIRADAPRASGDYLVEFVRGVAPTAPPYVGRTSSGYVMLPFWRLNQTDYQMTLIHELFHVLQFAHNYRLTDYWFSEASASWASLHFNRTAPIRPADNKPLHRERFGLFQSSSESLLSTAGDLEYGAYIYAQYMEQQSGGAGIVGGTWSRFGSVASHAQATAQLNDALAFKDHLRRFALRNVDQPLLEGDPVSPRYKVLDDAFPEAEFLPPYKDHSLDREREIAQPLDMPGLSTRYLRFIVPEGSGVQRVEFDFTGLSGRDHLAADALIENGERWVSTPVQLDPEPRPIFCFDLGPATASVRGAFFELRLVLANHALERASVVSGSLRVKASTGGCAGWAGEIRWSNLNDAPGVLRSDASTIADVVFEVNEDPPDGPTPGIVVYKVQSGRVRYQVTQTFTACSQIGSADVAMNPQAASGRGATVASLATFSTNGVPQYGSHSGATYGDITVTGNCTPDGSQQTVVHANQLIPWWPDPSGRSAYDLKVNGTLMQEDVSVSSTHGGARTQWTLRKIGK